MSGIRLKPKAEPLVTAAIAIWRSHMRFRGRGLLVLEFGRFKAHTCDGIGRRGFIKTAASVPMALSRVTFFGSR